MNTDYDLIVIGGGSGGIAAANKAGALGKKVLLIEKGPIGGTCVNLGCVPKKLGWYAGEFLDVFALAKAYGFSEIKTQLDYQHFVKLRTAYINRLHGGYEKNLAKNNVQLCQGKAAFVDERTVAVAGKPYTARHIIIATGSKALLPPIPGQEFALTSDDFFTWHAVPKKVVIVGAGYIAVELAGILNALGADVTMLIRKSRVLRQFDEIISSSVMESLEAHGITLIPHATVIALENGQNGTDVIYQTGEKTEKLHAEKVLFAIGREPLIADLNLAALKLHLNEKGYIKTDRYARTNINPIFAVGDVTGKKQLTPVAIAAGRMLIEYIYNQDKNAYVDYDNIPTVIYSHPPAGTIGLTEKEAIEKYGKEQVKVYSSNFNSLVYGMVGLASMTKMKLIVMGKKRKKLSVVICLVNKSMKCYKDLPSRLKWG